MTLKEPTSMEECVYFTNRINEKGKIRAWALKELCPKCKESLMGKPKDPKTGKVKIRADNYECPKCKYSVLIEEYEDTLTCNIKYTCSHCSNEGEVQVPFKRKKVKILDEESMRKKTADVIEFQCQKCNQNVYITKKMK